MESPIFLGEKQIGESSFIVAEGGVNHNGDPEIAKQLVIKAAECGADAIKFQKRTVEDILIKEALDRSYKTPNSLGSTYGEHRRKLELSEEVWRELAALAKKLGIVFFASVWDIHSADFIESLGVPVFKISSADLTNLPLLEHVAKKGKPVILSTGMSTIDEIDDAVFLIRRHNEKLVLLHAVSVYPCRSEKANLKMMEVLRRRYNIHVGYSGHETGIAVSIAAAVMGAAVIERHFTLDCKMRGPDHSASLEPPDLKMLVSYVREAMQAKGDGAKEITDEEWETRRKLAKSLVSARKIPKGEIITFDMLGAKGPGTGLKFRDALLLERKVAQLDIEEDTLIPEEALEWPNS